MSKIAPKNKQIVIKTILLLLYSALALAQGTADLPKVIPPSPNAANLGKYVETPVGMFTGTPQINIPIYDIKEGDLNLPISLSYQAGGIAVSEMASWTGLGWSLNAGGVITRRVEGLMDEAQNGYLNKYNAFPTGYAPQIQQYGSSKGDIDLDPDMFYMNAGPLSGKFVFDSNGGIHTIPLQKLKIESLGIVSSQFLHTSNYQHTSGWKVTAEDGTIYKFQAFEKSVNSNMYLDKMILSASYTPSVNSWYLTEITSANGDNITFTYQDVVLHYDLSASKHAYQIIYTPDVIDNPYASLPELPSATTTRVDIVTKRLSRIQFSNGSVDFIPASYGRADLVGDNALEKIIIKDKQGNIIKQFKLTYDYLVGNELIPYANIPTANLNFFSNFYTGQDSYPDSFGRRLMLNSIVEQDTNENSLNKGHRFEYFHDNGLPSRGSCNYDHWGFANQPRNSNMPLNYYLIQDNRGPYYKLIAPLGKEPDLQYCKQGALKTINYPTGGSTTYEYDLNEVSLVSPTNLPPILSKKEEIYLSVSHYRYDRSEYPYEIRTEMSTPQRHYYTEFQINDINGQAEIKINISPNIPYITNHSGFYIENTATNQRLWSGSTPSQYDFVTLPNGTYRLYHYPSDALLANPSSNPTAFNALYDAKISAWYEQNPLPSHYKIGGLRIKKIVTNDPVNNQNLVKTYDYELNGNSTGQHVSSPFYSYILHAFVDPSPFECGINDVCAALFIDYYVWSQTPAYPILRNQGSYVGYYFVTEKEEDLTGNSIGKTEYSFRSIYENPDIFPNGVANQVNNMFPFPPADSFDWARGQLKGKKIYKFNSSSHSYTAVENLVNSYDILKEIVSEGKKFGIETNNFAKQYHGGSDFAVNSSYKYHSGKALLIDSTTEKITNSGTFTTTSSTIYNQDNYLPSKTSMTASNGKTIHTYYSYPLDYTSGTSFIDNLITKNIVNAPIEVISATEDTSGNTNIVSGTLKEYDINNPGKAKEIFLLDLDEILSASTFKFSSKSLGSLPPLGDKSNYSKDSRYKSKYTLDYNNGRLRQTTERGASNKVYLWGYNEKYPVAMVENATISDVEATLTASELTGIKNGTYNQADAIIVLNKIRLGLPNAFVTTYTYNPLIGFTSITDPKGITTYYEYDEFNRLKLVKDAQGNLLSENKYHYQNQ